MSGIFYNSADDEMDVSNLVKLQIDIKDLTSLMQNPVMLVSYIDNDVGGNQNQIWKTQMNANSLGWITH